MCTYVSLKSVGEISTHLSFFNICKQTMATQEKIAFVTVGTTSFDALIEEISSEKTVTVLKRLGYSKVILQIGRGKIEPQQINQPDFCLEAYRYKDSIAEDIYNADLVISHAGAGSCLETLGARKLLLVVINELLMGNHQLELADQLCKDEHLFHTTPSKLAHDLETMDFSLLKPFPPCDPSNFSSFLDKALGVS